MFLLALTLYSSFGQLQPERIGLFGQGQVIELVTGSIGFCGHIDEGHMHGPGGVCPVARCSEVEYLTLPGGGPGSPAR